jgi:hypothetical protein
MKILRDARGSVFVTTMISMLVMLLVGGYMYAMSESGVHNVKQLQGRTQAKYLAEAGLANALGALRANWQTSATFAATTLANGSYSATVSTSSGRTLVRATGIVEGVSASASAEVIPPGLSALDYVIAGGGTGPHTIDAGTGQSNGAITGDVYAGGNLTIDGPSSGGAMVIDGDVQSTGTITNGSNASTSGSQTNNFTSTVSFPTVDYSFYQAIASANGTYYATDVTYASGGIPAAPAGGVIYVDGDLTIYGTQATTACLVATGNITIAKTGSTYPRVTVNKFSNYPALMTQNGSITFTSTGNGGAYLNVTGLIYSGNNFNFSSGNHDTFDLTGSILATGTISITPQAWNDTDIDYNQEDPPGFTSNVAEMRVASYNS